MEENDAVDLFYKLSNNNDRKLAKNIFEQIGKHPLMIQIVTKRADKLDSGSLILYAKELGSNNSEERIQKWLQSSYKGLNKDAENLINKLRGCIKTRLFKKALNSPL
jgi:hypothetical protein